MKKRKAIVIDIDDTVLDFGSRLREFYNMHYNGCVKGKSHEWDLCRWLNVDDGQDRIVLADFMDSWQFGALDGMAGAKRVLTKLVQEGYDIYCITACGLDPKVEALRRCNMYHVFGHIFEKIYFVDYGQTKVDYLTKIMETHDIHAFVDDKYDNLADGMAAGVDTCIMIKQPHNKPYREMGGVTVAYDWYEIAHILQAQQGTKWKIH